MKVEHGRKGMKNLSTHMKNPLPHSGRPQQASPAERGHDKGRDGEEATEDDVGLDRAESVRIDGARKPGRPTRQGEGEDLPGQGSEPEQSPPRFALPQRGQREPRAGA